MSDNVYNSTSSDDSEATDVWDPEEKKAELHVEHVPNDTEEHGPIDPEEVDNNGFNNPSVSEFEFHVSDQESEPESKTELPAVWPGARGPFVPGSFVVTEDVYEGRKTTYGIGVAQVNYSSLESSIETILCRFLKLKVRCKNGFHGFQHKRKLH